MWRGRARNNVTRQIRQIDSSGIELILDCDTLVRSAPASDLINVGKFFPIQVKKSTNNS